MVKAHGCAWSISTNRQLGWHYPQMAELEFTRQIQPAAHRTNRNCGRRSIQPKRDHHSAADESDDPFPIGLPNAFYPINFYDTREGEMRDANNGCAVNGIMNAVEINVGNLAKWLKGAGPYGRRSRPERELRQPERLHSVFLGSSRHAG